MAASIRDTSHSTMTAWERGTPRLFSIHSVCWTIACRISAGHAANSFVNIIIGSLRCSHRMEMRSNHLLHLHSVGLISFPGSLALKSPRHGRQTWAAKRSSSTCGRRYALHLPVEQHVYVG